MYDILNGMRVVEGSSFVAAPSCGLNLASLGAEVIRFDAIGGGPDFHRWPLAPDGSSLYWEGLNKGKKSIAINLSQPAGRELAVALITAPGDDSGLFVTNYPVEGFLSHERLVRHRADLITVRVMGWPDGGNAVDYTVNCAVGLPAMTGPPDDDAPVNHVLPAWDLLTGAHAAFSLLAAERSRRLTGKGGEIRIPLGDVAMATLGHLGQIAEVSIAGRDRPRMGNALFGAFGRDFVTGDGRRVMLVAITPRQWRGLVKALSLEAEIAAAEAAAGVSFDADEGMRFQHRDRLFPLFERAIAARLLAELARDFARHEVCWEPYQTLHQALDADPRCSSANPIFAEVQHPSGYSYLTPGASMTLPGSARSAPGPAPRLGQHTDEILVRLLALPEHEIARLHDEGIVAAAGAAS
jgi:2-methylfumaryl-CoA isomerase